MFTSSINVEGLQALLGGKDPVCGKDVQSSSAAATINRNDKTFHFCSIECKKTFDADPEKYSAVA